MDDLLNLVEDRRDLGVVVVVGDVRKKTKTVTEEKIDRRTDRWSTTTHLPVEGSYSAEGSGSSSAEIDEALAEVDDASNLVVGYEIPHRDGGHFEA